MADSHSVHLAFQSLALISRALTRLEVGGISISRFGETVDVMHPFEKGGVSDEAGASVLSKFTFSQRSTDVALLVQSSLADLLKARDQSSSTTASGIWSLALIVSDGLCQDHERLRALLRKAKEERIIFCFLVIDSLHRGTAEDGQSSNDQSILSMQSVQYANGQLSMRRYLDTFPFEQFIILRDAEALPEVLSSTLRQFFEVSRRAVRGTSTNFRADVVCLHTALFGVI
jgi:midasin